MAAHYLANRRKKMVCNYVWKSSRASYSEEDMSKAIDEVQSKTLGLRKAAEKYGIAVTTLQKRVKKNQFVVVNIGRYKPTFNTEQEEELKSHHLNLPKRIISIISLIKKSGLLENSGHKNSCQDLGVCQFEPQKQQARFFDLLQEVQLKYQFKPDRIFNLDETGVTVVQNPKKIIAQKGKKQVGRAISAERGKTATVVACVNAFGSFIPPVLIYKRVRLNPNLLTGAIPGTIGIPSPTGWIDTDIYFKVVEHFIKSVRASKDNPTLLIVDEHSSHKSLKAVNLCREHGIVVITLQPHCTYRLQPLDLTVFGPFKSYLNSEMDIWMTNHPGERITEYDMGPLIGNAFMRAATPNNICSGFKTSGIFPYNPNVFSDDDYAAADAVNAGLKEVLGDKNMNNEEAKDKKSVDSDIEGDIKRLESPNVSVSELLPLPKSKQKASKKNDQPSSAKVRNSKKVLRVKRNIYDEEPGVSGIKTKKKVVKKQKLNKEDDNCECIYCGGKFSDSAEDWIRCATCGLWSHEDCTEVELREPALDPAVGKSLGLRSRKYLQIPAKGKPLGPCSGKITRPLQWKNH
ncbi:uncharacterized protein LOC115877597 [Sitophilus oryzae]|uniref:Uncharacterized protein LOC115877597 n=1 Tax=Sitophilus oryzae TaxID=7048 RepID=A0A6J2XEE6_SITOR|nr:uncharacterized protein LOC115877597 [Sitophilus oryzae]